MIITNAGSTNTAHHQWQFYFSVCHKKSRCRPSCEKERGSHGLSARRARRTKSRGPKGLQLEVGARRAPRLLFNTKVCYDLSNPKFSDIEINNGYHLTDTRACNFAKPMDQQTDVAFNKGHTRAAQTSHYYKKPKPSMRTLHNKAEGKSGFFDL